MTGTEVMDRASASLNDPGRELFTDAILLPFLKNAWETLQSEMQNNGLPTVFEVSSTLTIPAGNLTISSSSTPALPTNFIEPLEVLEKSSNNVNWIPMTRIYSQPLNTNQSERLNVWGWFEDEIKLAGATADIEVLLRYIKSLPEISNPATELGLRGSLLYLAYKTAAGAAEDLGQNRTRADRLESKAELELQKFINIRVKGQQGQAVRRIPYGRIRRWPTLSPS